MAPKIWSGQKGKVSFNVDLIPSLHPSTILSILASPIFDFWISTEGLQHYQVLLVAFHSAPYTFEQFCHLISRHCIGFKPPEIVAMKLRALNKSTVCCTNRHPHRIQMPRLWVWRQVQLVAVIQIARGLWI
jgi:hypothetical protein